MSGDFQPSDKTFSEIHRKKIVNIMHKNFLIWEKQLFSLCAMYVRFDVDFQIAECCETSGFKSYKMNPSNKSSQ
jgi:hypothetical protein